MKYYLETIPKDLIEIILSNLKVEDFKNLYLIIKEVGIPINLTTVLRYQVPKFHKFLVDKSLDEIKSVEYIKIITILNAGKTTNTELYPTKTIDLVYEFIYSFHFPEYYLSIKNLELDYDVLYFWSDTLRSTIKLIDDCKNDYTRGYLLILAFLIEGKIKYPMHLRDFRSILNNYYHHPDIYVYSKLIILILTDENLLVDTPEDYLRIQEMYQYIKKRYSKALNYSKIETIIKNKNPINI